METPQVLDPVVIGLMSTAIIISLFLGIKSILKTEDIQKRQYKQTQLNEIIEWAEALTRCGKGIDMSVRLQYEKARINTAKYIHDLMFDMSQSLALMTARNEYIRNIVSLTFKSDLEEDMESIFDLLDSYDDILRMEHKEVTSNLEATVEKLSSHDKILNQLANSVIEKCCKIKSQVSGIPFNEIVCMFV